MTDDSRINDPQNRDPGKPGQEDFDEFLGGHSRVSKNYQALGDEGPPPALDARILAEAERATKVRSLETRNSNSRWMVPLAIAATIMLSFTLVMNMVSEPEISQSSRSNSADPARRRPISDEDQASASADMLTPGRIEAERAVAPRQTDQLKAQKPAAMVTGRGVQDSAARLEFARNIPMSAPATPNDLGLMIDTIRVYLESEMPVRALGATNLMAETEVSEEKKGKSSSLAMAQEKDRYTVPENQLQEILALYDSNQVEASGVAIRNFLTSFPDHPVSVLLMERGY